MKTFREHMVNGTWRRPISAAFAACFAFIAWKCWPTQLSEIKEALSSIQKAAFVTMAFAVTAYNLRTRVIDLLLKCSYKPGHIERLSDTARRCGRRLTTLVVLFTGTSLCMGVAAFFEFSPYWSRWVAAFVAALFGGSFISFFYILFAFERVEEFVLTYTVDEAKRKEIDRLTEKAGV